MAGNLGLEGMTPEQIAEMRRQFAEEDKAKWEAKTSAQKAVYGVKNWLFWNGHDGALSLLDKLDGTDK